MTQSCKSSCKTWVVGSIISERKRGKCVLASFWAASYKVGDCVHAKTFPLICADQYCSEPQSRLVYAPHHYDPIREGKVDVASSHTAGFMRYSKTGDHSSKVVCVIRCKKTRIAGLQPQEMDFCTHHILNDKLNRRRHGLRAAQDEAHNSRLS